MSRHWCHWCMISSQKWDKVDKWTIELIKDNLKKELTHLDMIPYEKRIWLPILFDAIPIENSSVHCYMQKNIHR